MTSGAASYAPANIVTATTRGEAYDGESTTLGVQRLGHIWSLLRSTKRCASPAMGYELECYGARSRKRARTAK